MKYEKLFEKGKIGNLPIKNRIVMTAMGTGFAAASGEASEEIIRYYEERAKGGVGLIITEVCRVDELSGIAQPCQLRGTDMNVIPSFTRLVDRVHAYGTKIFLQLQHPGNEAAPITLHGNPVIAPSPVVNQVIGAMPREMTTQEVEAMAGNYYFIYGDTLFLVLDYQDSTLGELTAVQQDWIKSVVAQNPAR